MIAILTVAVAWITVPEATASRPHRSSFGAWIAPLPTPVQVTRDFTPPSQRWLAGHRGVDLKAPIGAPVRSAGPGRIVYAGDLAGRPVVSIQHAPGVRTTYEPVTANVSIGDPVRVGQRIGRIAPDDDHDSVLHWGLKVRGIYVNPLRLIAGAVILKPSDGPGQRPRVIARPIRAYKSE